MPHTLQELSGMVAGEKGNFYDVKLFEVVE